MTQKTHQVKGTPKKRLRDVANALSALMTDVISGATSPNAANAAVRKLSGDLKEIEKDLRHAKSGTKQKAR